MISTGGNSTDFDPAVHMFYTGSLGPTCFAGDPVCVARYSSSLLAYTYSFNIASSVYSTVDISVDYFMYNDLKLDAFSPNSYNGAVNVSASSGIFINEDSDKTFADMNFDERISGSVFLDELYHSASAKTVDQYFENDGLTGMSVNTNTDYYVTLYAEAGIGYAIYESVSGATFDINAYADPIISLVTDDEKSFDLTFNLANDYFTTEVNPLDATPVSESSSLALAAMGLVALGFTRRRKMMKVIAR